MAANTGRRRLSNRVAHRSTPCYAELINCARDRVTGVAA